MSFGLKIPPSDRLSEMASTQAFSVSGIDPDDDVHDAMFAKRGCCCLLPCMGSSSGAVGSSSSSVWQRIMAVDKCEADDRWWLRTWRKVREWSELVAGPKWKTFIRRTGCAISRRSDKKKFRYDPLSYALNFDEGQKGHVEDGPPHWDFSTRFAPPSLPVSTNCSIDFDNDKNAPPIFK